MTTKTRSVTGRARATKSTQNSKVNPLVSELQRINTPEISLSKSATRNTTRMAATVYVADSLIHGKGLFAAKRLRADLTLGRLHGMPTIDEGTYVLWISRSLGLEITNEFRFINHSRDPNCALTDCDVVTLRSIAPDEELTHDYGW